MAKRLLSILKINHKTPTRRRGKTRKSKKNKSNKKEKVKAMNRRKLQAVLIRLAVLKMQPKTTTAMKNMNSMILSSCVNARIRI